MAKHLKKIASAVLCSVALISCKINIDTSIEKPKQKVLDFEDLALINLFKGKGKATILIIINNDD